MKEVNPKKIELGRSGDITLFLSEDCKRLLIKFDTDKEGLTKTGVNGMISALKEIRERMSR